MCGENDVLFCFVFIRAASPFDSQTSVFIGTKPTSLFNAPPPASSMNSVSTSSQVLGLQVGMLQLCPMECQLPDVHLEQSLPLIHTWRRYQARHLIPWLPQKLDYNPYCIVVIYSWVWFSILNSATTSSSVLLMGRHLHTPRT